MAADSSQASGNPAQLYTSLVITGAIALIVFLITIPVRRRFPHFYFRKCYTTNFGRDTVVPDINRANTRFSWIGYVITYAEEKFLQPNYGGVDQVLYLKFLKYAFFLYALLALLTCPVLIPIYYTGSNKNLNPDENGYVRGLDIITLSNLKQKSDKLWAPWVFTILTTVCMWVFLYRYASKLSQMNICDSRKKTLRNRTVMVHNINPALRNKNSIYGIFQRIFPHDSVVDTIMAPNAPEVRDVMKERKAASDKLKIIKDTITETDERPEHRPKILCCFPKVDSEQYFTEEIEKLDQKIVDAREKSKSDTTGVSFVTFNHSTTAYSAAQSLHRGNPWSMTVSLAPDPYAVFWENTNSELMRRRIGYWLSILMVTLLFLFWPIPVIFLSGLSNLDTLSQLKVFDFLIDLVEMSPILTGIISGILPTLVLTIFMALLPMILRAMHSVANPMVKTVLDRSVMRSYWAFLFFNVFFVTVVSGALFKNAQKLIDDFANTPNLLAASLPGMTTFFINYVLVGLTGHFIFLSRLPGLIVSRIFKRFLSSTKEEKDKRDTPAPFSIVEKLAVECLIFTIVLTYTTLGPLINIFGALYFAFSYFATKHHFMFALSPPYEGIKFGSIVIDFMFAALVIYQLLMIALFSLKYFPAGVAIIVLLVLTVALYIYIKMRFNRSYMYAPLTELNNGKISEEELSLVHDAYTDPVLKPMDKVLFLQPQETVPEDASPLESNTDSIVKYRYDRADLESAEMVNIIPSKQASQDDIVPTL